jgi:PAS domain S-box-containing protein
VVYSSIFNNTLDFLSVFKVENNDFYLESFNRSAKNSLGYSSSQLVGRRLKDLLDASGGQNRLNFYQKCVAEKKSQIFEEEIEILAGMKYYSTTLVPIENSEGVVDRVAAISRDISVNKRVEAELRKAKEAAEVANQSKSDFLASMSHELRTPLNVVLGTTQILAETPLTEEQSSFVQSIHRSGKILLNLIEDVLDVSKIEAGKVRLESVLFQVGEVVGEVLELFSMQAAEKSLSLQSRVGDGTDRVVIGDPARLRQILVNLVGNAIKFTDSGSVDVHVTVEESTDGKAIFHFSVVDTGVGIDEQDHEKLFKRFSQANSGNSRKYGGTGLGLMISKHLVSMMNGDIGFKSVKGKGTTFWFHIELPLSKHQYKPQPHALSSLISEKLPARVLSPGSETSKKLKVLAIDDNQESLNVVAIFIDKMGHEVTTAASAPEAIELLTSRTFDLLFMDVQMPDIDGYEATRRIRQLPHACAQIPIIALTANAMTGDAERCFDAGMDDYITKPLNAQALKNLLGKWAQRV